MSNLVTTTQEELLARTTNLMTRFELSLLKFKHKHPDKMIKEGLLGESRYMQMLTTNFIRQTGEN